MKRVFAIAVLVCALTGCGTVQNFERGGSVSNAVPYGGVEIAAERQKAGPHGGDFTQFDSQQEWRSAADVAGSVVGDTLTLPLTIAFQVAHDINECYFTSEKPQSNTWREFWFNDQPQTPPTRVNGGIY
jgi:uncharacterized protein YceK